jgi:hypothetical protein
MSLRFSRRIGLGKFLRFNLSRSGVSLSAGIPGARLNFGRNGIRRTIGIPGSGLSYSQKLFGGRTCIPPELASTEPHSQGLIATCIVRFVMMPLFTKVIIVWAALLICAAAFMVAR